jgi:hypothetical protein
MLDAGSPPGTGGVARSAGVVAKLKLPLTTATIPRGIHFAQGLSQFNCCRPLDPHLTQLTLLRIRIDSPLIRFLVPSFASPAGAVITSAKYFSHPKQQVSNEVNDLGASLTSLYSF